LIYWALLKNWAAFTSVYFKLSGTSIKKNTKVLSYISKKIGLEINVEETKFTNSHCENTNQGYHLSVTFLKDTVLWDVML